jgi:hypothetical protein
MTEELNTKKESAFIIQVGNFRNYEEFHKQEKNLTDEQLKQEAMTMFLTHRSEESLFLQKVMKAKGQKS